MTSTSRAVLGVCVLTLACQRPPPVDLGAKKYHDAVLLFAKLSDEVKDLSYRDPRFDQVLQLLGEVPVESEQRARADQLGIRIRQARADADDLDKSSAALRARADVPPTFNAQTQVVPAPAVTRASPPAALAAVAGWQGQLPAPSGAAQGARPLPALPPWYKQPNVSTPTEDSPPAGESQDLSQAQAQADPQAPPPPKTPARTPKPKPPPVGPPPVFGLPGPAGQALDPQKPAQ